MNEVFVGVGSNVEPEAHIRQAIGRIRESYPDVSLSSVYRSPAFGFDGDDFLNMVLRFDTDRSASETCRSLAEIERACGRVRGSNRYASRTIDLDMLMYGQTIDPAQRLPRDDVGRFPFVLGPLAELAPDHRHPLCGCSFSALWAAMHDRNALTCIGTIETLA